eukprot:scaffold1928_cov109-Alexandrium_tamarense.AAC.53
MRRYTMSTSMKTYSLGKASQSNVSTRVAVSSLLSVDETRRRRAPARRWLLTACKFQTQHTLNCLPSSSFVSSVSSRNDVCTEVMINPSHEATSTSFDVIARPVEAFSVKMKKGMELRSHNKALSKQ